MKPRVMIELVNGRVHTVCANVPMDVAVVDTDGGEPVEVLDDLIVVITKEDRIDWIVNACRTAAGQ